MAAALKSGDRFGHFRLRHVVGSGSSGSVWAAANEAVESRPVALKILNQEWLSRPDARRRLELEVQASRRVAHPGIVPVEAVLEIDERLALVMELLSGATLRTFIEREGSVAVGTGARIARDVAEVLAAAHAEGIAHRDLKPENVFLADPSRALGVRVLDFGLAKRLPNAALEPGGVVTALGSVLGTPAYMAPEQARGAAVDERADIWALGVMLYELLAGCRPIEGASAEELMGRLLTDAIAPIEFLVPDLPEPVVGLLGAMLERDAERRPSAAAVESALSSFA